MVDVVLMGTLYSPQSKTREDEAKREISLSPKSVHAGIQRYSMSFCGLNEQTDKQTSCLPTFGTMAPIVSL